MWGLILEFYYMKYTILIVYFKVIIKAIVIINGDGPYQLCEIALSTSSSGLSSTNFPREDSSSDEELFLSFL